jgi:hypothetical protein
MEKDWSAISKRARNGCDVRDRFPDWPGIGHQFAMMAAALSGK